MKIKSLYYLFFLTPLFFYACSEKDANELKIGGECATLTDCGVDADDEDPPILCLPDFKGGYCGKKACTQSIDCPEGSACATLENVNYCFLICVDKPDCNQNRSEENLANCESSIKTLEGGEQKLCVPPSAS